MKISKLSAAVGGVLLSVAALAPAAQAAPPAFETRPVMIQVAETAASRLIVKYKSGTAEAGSVSSKLAVVRSAAARAGIVQAKASGKKAATPLAVTHGRALGLGADALKLSRKLTQAELQTLLTEVRADPSVAYVQEDRKMHAVRDLAARAPQATVTPQLVPNDTYYAQYQWHLFNPNGGINAPAAWDISTGEGVVVAVLDTGILPAHPDMASGDHLLQGYDFITDTFVSRRPTDARVPGALDYGDWNDDESQCPVGDSSWHGTHTAGTVGELTNNGLGMAGVAHDAQILPVRVLGRCGGYTSDIADAIVWASGGAIPGVAANADPAEVISLSLGGSGPCGSYEQAAINTAVTNGSLVVVAAGNQSENASNHSPANCNNVVTVGATGVTGGKAYYSNYGSTVEIAAPGGGVNEGSPNGYVWQAGYDGPTTPTSGAYVYMGMAGTSMATPHVAAVAALVQSALAAEDKPALTPASPTALLTSTARPFPVSVPTSTPIGSGIVDAKAALDKALEEPCDPTQETCGPVAIPLTNKVEIKVAGAAGSETLYSFDAAAGTTLSLLTMGGSGNVSMYVSFEEAPSTSDYDAKSTRPGNNETVRFKKAQAGTYYIKLVGASAYSNVTLVARQ